MYTSGNFYKAVCPKSVFTSVVSWVFMKEGHSFLLAFNDLKLGIGINLRAIHMKYEYKLIDLSKKYVPPRQSPATSKIIDEKVDAAVDGEKKMRYREESRDQLEVISVVNIMNIRKYPPQVEIP